MDEERFSAKWFPDKRDYYDFGRIHTKKTRLSLLCLILAAALFVLAMVTIIFGEGSGTFLLTMGYLMFFYWLFFGDLIGRNAYKNITKKNKDLEQIMYFGDTAFSGYTEMGSSSLNYEALESVCENDHIFALYVSKAAAHVLPKTAFTEGTPDTFRAFMERKTGRPVKRFHTADRLGGRIAAAIVGFVAMLGCMVGAMLLRDGIFSAPKTFTEGNYSITLPGNFEKDTPPEEEDGDYCDFFSDGAGIFVTREDDRDVKDYFGHQPTLEEYAQDWLDYWEVDDAEITKAADGTVRIQYDYEDEDGEEYCYYSVVQRQSGYYWLTEFCCHEEDRAWYGERFVTWADSIEIR